MIFDILLTTNFFSPDVNPSIYEHNTTLKHDIQTTQNTPIKSFGNVDFTEIDINIEGTEIHTHGSITHFIYLRTLT